MTEYRNFKPDDLNSDLCFKHVDAMTREDLRDKGDIARELAFRDAEIEQLRTELQSADSLRERLTTILTEIANALKGEPKKLTAHSWHDLAEVAGRLRKERDLAYEAGFNNAVELVSLVDRPMKGEEITKRMIDAKNSSILIKGEENGG